MNSPRRNFRLPDELMEALNQESQERGLSMAAVLREALLEHFERRGKRVNLKPMNWGGRRARDAGADTLKDNNAKTSALN